MRTPRHALLMIASLAALSLATSGGALAQYRYNKDGGARSFSSQPTRGGGDGNHGGRRGGDWGRPRHHGGWGGVATGIIMTVPEGIDNAPPSRGSVFIDDGTVHEAVDGAPPRHRRVRHHRTHKQRTAQRPPRGPSGAPPAGETRLVPDEVVITLANSTTAAQVDALQRRYRLVRIESQRSALAGVTLYRWRIPDRRAVATVVRQLEQNAQVVAAQPNYLFTLQDGAGQPNANATAAQYELAKLHLPQAHTLATGDNVRVAVIDSAVDLQSPELKDSIADSLDTLKSPRQADKHGTAVAGLIAAHGQLTGAAPAAKLLVVRAFDPDGTSGAQGTTFNILKGLDWAAENGARVINMSFAGPADPALHRALEAASRKNIVLVAAAGNAGAKSPPLYPAAEPDVIAVSATDADDHLLAASNRGKQIALAAPGADILVTAPGGGVAMSSGTSYSAAEVSGVVALLLQRDGELTPGQVLKRLARTATDLGRKGKDPEFGAGLVNAYDALIAGSGPLTASVPLPISRVSTGAK